MANACRTCGRWPSLFEIEGSTIESDAPVVADDPYEARTVDIEDLEPEVFDSDVEEVELPPELESDDEVGRPSKPAWQRFARLIVPIGVVLYILISAIANRGGSG